MDETSEVKATTAPVAKNKGGRPKRNAPKLKKEQSVAEIVPVVPVAAGSAPAFPPTKHEWPTKRAARIRIQRNVEEGEEIPFQLGDSPILYVRRNVEVVVPWDIIGLLNDMVVDMPRCTLEPHKKPVYWTEKVTRAEYSFLGEVPWQDYIDYRDAQRKLK